MEAISYLLLGTDLIFRSDFVSDMYMLFFVVGRSCLLPEGYSRYNFGPPLPAARVLIGGKTCRIRLSDQGLIVCTLQPGTLLNNQIVILQGTGRLYVAPVESYAVSYYQCPSGQAYNSSNPFQCLTCPVGSYSSFPESKSPCLICPAGSIGVQAGLSACFLCPVGSRSEGNSCQGCSPGTYSATIGSSVCVMCSTGTYAPSENATSCLPTPRGSYTDAVGMSRAQFCPPGTHLAAWSSFFFLTLFYSWKFGNRSICGCFFTKQVW